MNCYAGPQGSLSVNNIIYKVCIQNLDQILWFDTINWNEKYIKKTLKFSVDIFKEYFD